MVIEVETTSSNRSYSEDISDFSADPKQQAWPLSLTREAWGTVSLSEGLFLPNGRWISAISGYLVVVTDRDWPMSFHSSERWQLLVFADDRLEQQPVFIIPGCRVNGVFFWPRGKEQETRCAPGEPRLFDATTETFNIP